MSGIEVESTVKVYEFDGEDVIGIDGPTIRVLSHWNNDQFVVLDVKKRGRITVAARDLKLAVANAVNRQ